MFNVKCNLTRFYDTGNTNRSLVHQIWWLCDSDITSFPLADAAREVNIGLENLVGKILGADGDWQWDDDSNYTDLPRARFTLVEGQESYTLSTPYLEIEHMDVLQDASPDMWRRLTPIDRYQLGDMTYEEYFGLLSNGNPATGLPEYYDKISNISFRLFPAPTSTYVTLTNGLRITFKRTIDLFTASDTTQEPGIPAPYHSTLAYMAAIGYCMKYKPERVARYQARVEKDITDLLAFYGRREKDKRHIMTMAETNFY